MPYLIGILLADIMFRFKSNEAKKVFKRVRNPLSLWDLLHDMNQKILVQNKIEQKKSGLPSGTHTEH